MKKQTDYQRYLNKLRQRPDAIVLVEADRGLRTFAEGAVGAAERLGRPVKRVDRHRTVDLKEEDVAVLVGLGLRVAMA